MRPASTFSNIQLSNSRVDDPQARWVLYMRYIVGMRLNRIAEREGVTYAQIKYSHARGLQDIVVFALNPCYDIY